MKKYFFYALITATAILAFIVITNRPQNNKTSDTITPTPAANNSKDMQKFSKLETEDIKVGTGKEVKPGDTVIMHYTGTLVDGTKFDSSKDRGNPFTTQIGTGMVIEGWDKGVPGMKVGGKRILRIPSSMGYGTRGAGNVIPPNADLIFEVELLEIK